MLTISWGMVVEDPDKLGAISVNGRVLGVKLLESLSFPSRYKESGYMAPSDLTESCLISILQPFRNDERGNF
jgi:hypothetical protein